MHQSIPAAPIPARGVGGGGGGATAGHLHALSVPGLGINPPQAYRCAFDTCGF